MWHAASGFTLLAALAVVSPDAGADFWIPMTFLVAGAMLFLWELSMPGFFIAVAAIPLLILGVIGLAVEGFFTKGVIWPLLIGLLVVAPTMMITLRVYRSWAPPDAAPTTTSAESMQGREGTVTVPVDTETTKGKVRIQGIMWSAKCDSGVIPEGTRVAVKEVRGVHVLVAPVEPVGGAGEQTPTQSGPAGAQAGGREESV